MTLYTVTTEQGHVSAPMSRREAYRLERLLRPYHRIIVVRRVQCVTRARPAFTDRVRKALTRFAQGSARTTPDASPAT